MKNCPNCANPVNDDAVSCPQCGTQLQTEETKVNVFDHTAEFDAEDMQENKLMAMLLYLLGIGGIVLSLLKGGKSAFVAFHTKQAMKILVAESAATFVLTAGAIINIVPILGTVVYLLAALAAFIVLAVTTVIRVIALVYVCKGQVKEVPVIRSIKLFK